MFTGLIQAIGKVVEFRPTRVRLSTPWALKKGESIAIDGVCLTVTALKGKIADFDLGPETLRLTTLGSLKTGQFGTCAQGGGPSRWPLGQRACRGHGTNCIHHAQRGVPLDNGGASPRFARRRIAQGQFGRGRN
jgi:hypothetical protein